MILFSEFLEKKYPIKRYPTEKLAKEKIRQMRSENAKKTSPDE
jgi:hypothetical protein